MIYFSSLVVCSLSYQIKQPNMTIFQYDLTEKSNQHMIKYFYKYWIWRMFRGTLIIKWYNETLHSCKRHCGNEYIDYLMQNTLRTCVILNDRIWYKQVLQWDNRLASKDKAGTTKVKITWYLPTLLVVDSVAWLAVSRVTLMIRSGIRAMTASTTIQSHTVPLDRLVVYTL